MGGVKFQCIPRLPGLPKEGGSVTYSARNAVSISAVTIINSSSTTGRLGNQEAVADFELVRYRVSGFETYTCWRPTFSASSSCNHIGGFYGCYPGQTQVAHGGVSRSTARASVWTCDVVGGATVFFVY